MTHEAFSREQQTNLILTLLRLAHDTAQPVDFTRQSIAIIREIGDLRSIAYIVNQRGAWRTVSQTVSPSGNADKPPREMIALAAESEQWQRSGDWCAIPLRRKSRQIDVMVVLGAGEETSSLAPAAATLAQCLDLVVERSTANRHRAQTAARLTTFAATVTSAEMTRLLTDMAAAINTAQSADHTVIGLWDKRANELACYTPTHMARMRVAADAGLPQRIVVDRRPAHHSENGKSKVGVPIVGFRNQLLGALWIELAADEPLFVDVESELAAEAEFIAEQIDNSGHFQKLLRPPTDDRYDDQVRQLLGGSAQTVQLRSAIQRVAASDLPVLVLGDNGTGKEVTSQLIHAHSPRREGPFLAVNCAALTETLLESELFGHEAGAFTDATERRSGKFELAHGGTLFLDEVGEMSAAGQAKLLRVLEKKRFERVGGSETIATDARVIAATNRDLAAAVRTGDFREDLFYRLNVVTLKIAPLRDRPEDILPLAEYFLREHCLRGNRQMPLIDPTAQELLLRHNWPGNVRELRNLMERVTFLESAETITGQILAGLLGGGSDPIESNMPSKLTAATHEFQRRHIQAQIDDAAGNMTAAAKNLGLHRSNLYRKMRQLGLPTTDE